MILKILGLLIGIYVFARSVVKNEPLKGQINSIIDTTNNTLSIYKDKKPRQLFDNLLDLSTKGMLYSFILCFFVFLFPESIERYLILLIAPILFLCAIIYFSISWIKNHNRTFKEIFLNFPMLGVLFSPIIFYFLDLYFKTDGVFSGVFYPFNYAFENIGLVYFQIFWILGVFSIFYIGMIAVALPVYLIVYTLIIISVYIIKIFEKHINGHILDGIIGLATLMSLFLSFLY